MPEEWGRRKEMTFRREAGHKGPGKPGSYFQAALLLSFHIRGALKIKRLLFSRQAVEQLSPPNDSVSLYSESNHFHSASPFFIPRKDSPPPVHPAFPCKTDLQDVCQPSDKLPLSR